MATDTEELVRLLGARRVGGGWMARCPAHDDHEPSLSINETGEGKVLVHCHAGCSQPAVIAALRSLGWQCDRPSESRSSQTSRLAARDQPEVDASKRTEAALAIWRASQPAVGTAVETYLRSRDLTVAPPASIRYHQGLRHPAGGVWPAAVALVTDGVSGAPLGIHRTFLALDGSGKAPVSPAKMMLGPCRGGVVRLGEPGRLLMIGEGIETCLSVIQEKGHPAWAALSTSGLRALQLPAGIHDVVVLADGDDAGEQAAQACAHRWKRGGRRVRIVRPPRGMDFNDLLVLREKTLRDQ